jgi:hypothetical protein
MAQGRGNVRVTMLASLGPAPVSHVDAAFYPAAWSVGTALGLPPATAGYDVAQILYSESTIVPSSMNSIGCGGINGFCPGSLSGISVADFVKLSASQQLLQYVQPFWAKRVKQFGGIDRAVDLYWLNWYPATYKRGVPGTYIVNPHVGAGDYEISGGRSVATVNDLQAFLTRGANDTRWKAIKQNLAPFAPIAVPAAASSGLLAYGALVASLGVAWWVWRHA